MDFCGILIVNKSYTKVATSCFLMQPARNLSCATISTTKNGKDQKVDMSTQLAETLNELLSKAGLRRIQFSRTRS